ncbi:MAG: DUF4301 domain-containing protein [Bacteroidetes bacterium]|nr:MAG: DUF4301 domain-containing protein [Bacteroidota bacterium]
MSELSEKDIKQIKNKGISISEVETQISNFKRGFPFSKLLFAAVPKKGIIQLSDKLVDHYQDFFSKKAENIKVTKFVPASGAASRMFKHLFEFREALNTSTYENLKLSNEHNKAIEFFNNINNFAFSEELNSLVNINDYSSITEYTKDVLDMLLTAKGMNYAQLPKALLKFHKYTKSSRKAIEEHLVEAAEYANNNSIASLHFTVSPDHLQLFKTELNELVPSYEYIYEVKYDIEFSTQKSSTDTIAADINNEPFRDNNGDIVFRPGGHGALIENLNEIDADIIFIKNIDNVASDTKNETTILYKRTLGGLAIKFQEIIFEIVSNIDKRTGFDKAEEFIVKALGLEIPDAYNSYDDDEKYQYLKAKLNRPLRICGVVQNDGEPGGGPFWVEKNGNISLQIVESSEVDLNDKEQKEIMQESTHFNPVDLVCCIKDYQGNKFNLSKYIDYNSAFISNKSKDGKILKAMELPGLWNGAMAFWNTIFVEVPIETFNPVKTVNDLLKDMHID